MLFYDENNECSLASDSNNSDEKRFQMVSFASMTAQQMEGKHTTGAKWKSKEIV